MLYGMTCAAPRGGKFLTCPLPRHGFHKLKTRGHESTRAGSPNTEASCIHEKHDIVSFFLGKRSLLVLRMASCHAEST
jgi:hypothetical protein